MTDPSSMTGFGWLTSHLRGAPGRADPADMLATPATAGGPPTSLYLFGPAWAYTPGVRIEAPAEGAQGGIRALAERPGFHGPWPFVGDPGDRVIWRLRPELPHALHPAGGDGLWRYGAATVLEALSPAVVVPAWPDVVRLCARLRALTHDEVVAIAAKLPEPTSGAGVPRPTTVAGLWAAWSVGAAARAVDAPELGLLRPARTSDGSRYDDLAHPAWRRVQVEAVRVADAVAAGTGTLRAAGRAFGPWPTAKRRR